MRAEKGESAVPVVLKRSQKGKGEASSGEPKEGSPPGQGGLICKKGKSGKRGKGHPEEKKRRDLKGGETVMRGFAVTIRQMGGPLIKKRRLSVK